MQSKVKHKAHKIILIVKVRNEIPRVFLSQDTAHFSYIYFFPLTKMGNMKYI